MIPQPKIVPELTSDQWQDIQGFVVYGYGILPYARYLFLHVQDVAKAKKWLGQVTDEIMTVQHWYDRVDRDVAINVAVTYQGLQKLQVPMATLETFSREFIEGIYEETRSRLLGDTGDSSPETWQVGNPRDIGTDSEPHIVVLINSKTKAGLVDTMSSDLFKEIGADKSSTSASGVYIVSDQMGSTPTSKKEPFGFRDGISNPWIANTRDLILGQRQLVKNRNGKQIIIGLEDDPVIKTGEFILGYEDEYGQLPSSPLLLNEPDAGLPVVDLSNMPSTINSVMDFGRNGSYVVYRKLEQDIEGFWKFMREQSEKYYGGADGERMSWLGAKCVGRWSSGVPMALAPDKDDPELAKRAADENNNSLINNFHYINQGPSDKMDDEHGFGCPWGSHIRRNHPRDSLIDSMHLTDIPARSASSRQHRIMRRSVSWGKLADYQVHEPDYIENKGAPLEITFDHDHDFGSDEEGRGIHFFGVNANIQRQFEFIMHAWANDERFNGLYDNKDPILGDASTPNDPTHMDIPNKGSFRQRLPDLPRFVHVRGGAYLFMPGIAALKYMSK